MNISPWECYLPREIVDQLPSSPRNNHLSLLELKELIEPLNAASATITGGEPTIDRELPDVVKLLNDLGMKTYIYTNGQLLGEDLANKLKTAGITNIYFGIKAYTEDIHLQYTGQSNRHVLENFRRLKHMGVSFRAGGELIPGIIGEDEVMKVAKFIGEVDPNLEYSLAGYVRAPNTPWASPSREVVKRAAQKCKTYLKTVRFCYSEMPLLGDLHLIYPKLGNPISKVKGFSDAAYIKKCESEWIP